MPVPILNLRNLHQSIFIRPLTSRIFNSFPSRSPGLHQLLSSDDNASSKFSFYPEDRNPCPSVRVIFINR